MPKTSVKIRAARKKTVREDAVKVSLPETPPSVSNAVLETVAVETPPPPPLKDPVESFRWGWVGLSILIPLAGILIGLFLYDRESSGARRVGRTSLLLGFVLWILLPLALIALLSVLGFVSALGWISSLMPPQP